MSKNGLLDAKVISMPSINNAVLKNIKSGGVIAYPTSTLPGLGCLPNRLSLDNLFALKRRSPSQPVSLGVASLEQAMQYVIVPNIAKSILSDFPTGSLTLILDAKETLDERLGGNRVAVRVLADKMALELVKLVGPITATSANHSGVDPHHNVTLAAKQLGLSEDSIVDGNCPGGAPSTILSIEKSTENSNKFTVSIMREGVVPSNDVETWMRNYH